MHEAKKRTKRNFERDSGSEHNSALAMQATKHQTRPRVKFLHGANQAQNKLPLLSTNVRAGHPSLYEWLIPNAGSKTKFCMEQQKRTKRNFERDSGYENNSELASQATVPQTRARVTSLHEANKGTNKTLNQTRS